MIKNPITKYFMLNNKLKIIKISIKKILNSEKKSKNTNKKLTSSKPT
jgi:hypothetical protein